MGIKPHELQECIERTPHRVYRMYEAWLEMEWNRPSRSDWYLMKVAQKVQGLFRKREPEIDKQLIKFEPKQKRSRIKESVEAAKARWFGIVGYKPKKK